MENIEFGPYINTVEIPTSEYKALLEAAHREELLKKAFDHYSSGTSYSDLSLDSDIFHCAFSLLYPEDYKRIVERCKAEHEARKNG